MENTDASNKIIDISSNVPQQKPEKKKKKKKKSYKSLMKQLMKPQVSIEDKVKQFHEREVYCADFKKIDKI